MQTHHQAMDINNLNMASGSITVAKNLYDGGQTSANMKLAEIQLDQATANYLATEQIVILIV